jgi:hypothetical protein
VGSSDSTSSMPTGPSGALAGVSVAAVTMPVSGSTLADALGEGVVQLLTEPALWQEASRAARAAAARHTWDRRAQELACHFARLASARRPGGSGSHMHAGDTPVAEDYEALNAAQAASDGSAQLLVDSAGLVSHAAVATL